MAKKTKPQGRKFHVIVTLDCGGNGVDAVYEVITESPDEDLLNDGGPDA
jgi:hypothetical protein